MDMVGLTYLNMLVVKKVFTLSKYNFFLGIHKNSNIYEEEEIKNLMKFIWKENIDLKKLMWSEVILLCHFPFLLRVLEGTSKRTSSAHAARIKTPRVDEN